MTEFGTVQADNTTGPRNEMIAKVCPNCGTTVLPEAPRGFCSLCLFKTGLGEFADENGEKDFAAHIPTQFGDYELKEEIGRGAQGVVYRARQKSLNRTVALKIVALGHWASTTHLKRFRLEAEAAAGLNHPSIVPIHEIGERDGCCYFSMNFVDGKALDEVAKREPMSTRAAAQLVAKLARTVNYAHERGILHRDIKPGNILLDGEGEPHLTDFGLARLVAAESTVTRTTEALGTPSYMAPEQARGDNATLTRAADIYSLGAVLYQLLTNRPPFLGATTYETVRLLLETEPRPPRLLNSKVDRDLSTICLKCLEKDPQRRYSSALALAEDLEHCLRHEPIRARRTGFVIRGKKWLQRNPTTAILTGSLAALAAVLGVIFWNSELVHPPPSTGIAVLPFENLNPDKENAMFADGVQDDILTKLAKVADLKVISRTSVMAYRGARNIRQIGAALHVSHVLEGSMRRDAGRFHLNAQLIDARSDRHVWAEEYDRDLNDMFAIQSEIAQKVAEQLHAKVSLSAKRSIELPPTTDLAAFDLYTRAKTLLLTIYFSMSADQNVRQAIELLDQAVARDPAFFEAYCQLVYAHSITYAQLNDRTSNRLDLAEAALQGATRLRPDAGETHLARANYLYMGRRDYQGALDELATARRSLPNDPRLFELTGFILRRHGQQEEGLRQLERAAELDPRNFVNLQQIALSNQFLRRYREEAAALDRALDVVPTDAATQGIRARVEFYWKADTRPLRQTIEAILTRNPGAIPEAADSWFLCALADRDAAAADRALVALGDNACWDDDAIKLSRSFGEGLLARLLKDEARAQVAFTKARLEQEQIVKAQPDYGPSLCVLGLIDAALGSKEEALREGRRAIELFPVERDSMNGSRMLVYFAIIAAWAGEKELALQQLAAAAHSEGGDMVANYGALKLLPFWDPLRGDPRFEAIVNSLAPK